jgi:hypothetical protein
MLYYLFRTAVDLCGELFVASGFSRTTLPNAKPSVRLKPDSTDNWNPV